MYWTDSYGRKTLIQNLEDTHLANIINYLKQSEDNRKEMLPILELEANRGLSQTFLERAEIPHKNPKTNQWMLWNKEHNRPMPVSK